MKSYRLKVALALSVMVSVASAQSSTPASHSPCQIHSVVFDGWQAQEVTNDWLRLTFVPQLGGRLMQVAFNGHPFLFVNPQFKGKYISPAEAAGRWINYGGDKIWQRRRATLAGSFYRAGRWALRFFHSVAERKMHSTFGRSS
jgi:hypothetical protein